MTKYSAIILAGGKSRRMGQKKGELIFRGKTFYEVLIEKLNSLGIKEILLSGYDYKDDRVIFVEDIYKDKGPLAGIHSGLIRSSAESVLVITEDAPFVPEDFIKQLMAKHKEGSAMITLASCRENIQQLVGIYDKGLAPLAEKILNSERPTVKNLINKAGYVLLPYEGEEIMIRGCNTPEEYIDMVRGLKDYKRR